MLGLALYTTFLDSVIIPLQALTSHFMPDKACPHSEQLPVVIASKLASFPQQAKKLGHARINDVFEAEYKTQP